MLHAGCSILCRSSLVVCHSPADRSNYFVSSIIRWMRACPGLVLGLLSAAQRWASSCSSRAAAVRAELMRGFPNSFLHVREYEYGKYCKSVCQSASQPASQPASQ